MENNIKLYGFDQEKIKPVGYDRLPVIGWFVRRKLGLIFIIILILIFLYYYVYKKQNNIASVGCTRNGCFATPCYGPNCKGDNCVGIGCHAGSCYGEACQGGTCEGPGCKGGDCYGANCKVGNCVDPNCPNNKEKLGLCKPNCSWGRAYNLPSPDEPIKSIKNLLPYNTSFNKNYCVKPYYISESLVKDDAKLYNFKIAGANYYYGGFLSFEEIQDKVKKGSIIDDKKGLVRIDDPIISTIPKIYKNWNCLWETNFNTKSISAKLLNNYNKTNVDNVERHDYVWSKIKTAVVVLDNKGNETMCPILLNMGPHLFSKLSFYLDIEQLKDIMGIQKLDNRMSQIMTLQKLYYDNDYQGIRSYMKTIDFFQDKINIDTIINNISNYSNKISLFEKIEQIRGTIISSNCDYCNEIGNRVLVNDKLPSNLFGQILPCKDRVYIYDKITENYDPSSIIDKSSVTYKLINMKIADSNFFSVSDKEQFINKIHSLKNNHLMFYYDTDIQNKTMIYICFFCGQKSYLKLNSLIKLNNIVDNRGINYSLGNCVRPDDFNHYMYEVLDNNQNIYYKCIKCQKLTY
jgi:hypothetical protein